MLIIMKSNATPQQIENVIAKIKEEGLAAHLSQGIETTLIGAIGETHDIPMDAFEVLDGVDMVKRITQPFKLASRQFHPENSIFPIDGFQVGGNEIAIIAGPCSVESRSQILGDGPGGERGGSECPARRSFQTAYLSIFLPGFGRRRTRISGRGARTNGHADCG